MRLEIPVRQPSSDAEQQEPPPAKEDDPFGACARRHARRVRRLKRNAIAWAVGAIVLTTIWVRHEWRTNGAFERIGNQGNPGDWNPTLLVVGVGLWTLVVGIMALRVHFERPVAEDDVRREIERLREGLAARGTIASDELSRFALVRLERIRRLRFHVAAWLFGMVLLTPIWLLVEWQDNGRFEHWSNNSRPGDWDPWILPVGGVWAGVIALYALRVLIDRPSTEGEVDREVRKLKRRG